MTVAAKRGVHRGGGGETGNDVTNCDDGYSCGEDGGEPFSPAFSELKDAQMANSKQSKYSRKRRRGKKKSSRRDVYRKGDAH